MAHFAAAFVFAAVAPPDDRLEIAPGVYMPRVSCGHPDDQAKNATAATLAWILAGGMGIDTADSYHNQPEIAVAIAASGVERKKLFITTKVPCEGDVYANIEEDLRELQTSYVDLMLIHFPCKDLDGTRNAWKALQAAHDAGLARSIGVSNFLAADLDAVMALGGVTPSLNQCQMSVGSHDDAMINKTRAAGATYEAYSPLRHVDLSDPTLTKIAHDHNVSTAQVALRWIYQQGVYNETTPDTYEESLIRDRVRAYLISSKEIFNDKSGPVEPRDRNQRVSIKRNSVELAKLAQEGEKFNRNAAA
jgi:diketogulonate reductase-like aldo/keto reductase